ncbi:hypothetical protein [Phytohabitans rumicis]|uniref:hypothetical protein n=1 Tax=Phytohabitans rumicis TaxID=1076125 RepID=UPI0015676B80|nr:hypothetical protein [Phytohabitans rumicis]
MMALRRAHLDRTPVDVDWGAWSVSLTSASLVAPLGARAIDAFGSGVGVCLDAVSTRDPVANPVDEEVLTEASRPAAADHALSPPHPAAYQRTLAQGRSDRHRLPAAGRATPTHHLNTTNPPRPAAHGGTRPPRRTHHHARLQIDHNKDQPNRSDRLDQQLAMAEANRQRSRGGGNRGAGDDERHYLLYFNVIC